MVKRGTPPDDLIIDEINSSIRSGKHFDIALETHERILARVTDGIHGQPACALRELIANSFDADATTVAISTDAPRFSAIKVSDDGIGMSPEVLANMVLHIGGSAKRTQRGPKIGITSKKDPLRSRKGRRLIGKIGIGLFSVAQLTRQFTVITKTAGTDYQLLAHVTLNRFDETAELAKIDPEGEHTFQAGEARIWAEKTPDTRGHGTAIHLSNLLPRVVHILQSRDVWAAIREEQQAGGRLTRLPPLYHIGQIDPDNPDTLCQAPSLPWPEPASERERFTRLVCAVAEAWMRENLYARLEHALDYYFQMIWLLGLSLPLEYVEKHPFSLTGKDVKHCYRLPDRRRGVQAKPIKVGKQATIGGKFGFTAPDDVVTDFAVTIDGVQLARPIRFHGYPKTSQAFQDHVIFVGQATPDLSKIPESQRGGPLSFSGYFFWTPRVIPQEHNGLLVRINGASGTLFDPTFLKYQVGERRLGQLMAEVFCDTGLEGALNIDRESFNTAHPHYQILANWVHNSLRIIRNTIKAMQAEARRQRQEEQKEAGAEALVRAVDNVIRELTDSDPSDVPDVVLAAGEAELEHAISEGKIGYLREEIMSIATEGDKTLVSWAGSHASAVARFLDACGVLQNLDRAEQSRLVAGILKIFAAGK